MSNPHTLIFSPHCAFSLGGSLAYLRKAGGIELVTIFTRSSYAPKARYTDEETINAVRREEEYLFVKKSDIMVTYLDFPDSSLRGYDDQTEALADPAQDPVRNEVQAVIKDIIRRSPACLVFGPLGVGNHIDHLIVRDAIASCGGKAMSILYYEELPYAAEVELAEIAKLADDFDHLTPKVLLADLTKKRQLIGCYISQVDMFDQELMTLHAFRRATINPVEVVWARA